jgi:hypothetical protein
MPSVVLVTDEFMALASESARDSGLPQLRLVAVPHPIGGVAREELLQRADAATDEILARFYGLPTED